MRRYHLLLLLWISMSLAMIGFPSCYKIEGRGSHMKIFQPELETAWRMMNSSASVKSTFEWGIHSMPTGKYYPYIMKEGTYSISVNIFTRRSRYEHCPIEVRLRKNGKPMQTQTLTLGPVSDGITLTLEGTFVTYLHPRDTVVLEGRTFGCSMNRFYIVWRLVQGMICPLSFTNESNPLFF